MRRVLSIAAVVLVPVNFALFSACVGDDASTSTGGSGNDSGSDSPSTPPPPPPPGPSPQPAEGGGGDSGGKWTPAVLDANDSLALWLEASAANLVISSGKVGTWHDLSKHKNDATNTQNGPSVHASAVNAHDAVHFTEYGVSLSMGDPASLHFGQHQIYIAAVAKASATATGPGFYYSKASHTSFPGNAYKTGLEFFSQRGADEAGAPIVDPRAHINSMTGGPDNEIAWGTDVFSDGKFHLLTFRRVDSGTIAIAADNATPHTATTGQFDLDEVGVGAVIGSVTYGEAFTPPVDFEVAELVIIHANSGVVADSDVSALRGYLKAKYGL